MLVTSLFALVLIATAAELARGRPHSLSGAILVFCLAWMLIWGALSLRLACFYDFCPKLLSDHRGIQIRVMTKDARG